MTAMPVTGLFLPAPGQVGFSEDLVERAVHVLNGKNMVEVILYSHLLLEQALDLLIEARFRRLDTLVDPKLATLPFAQKMTVYVGLYDPDKEQIAVL